MNNYTSSPTQCQNSTPPLIVLVDANARSPPPDEWHFGPHGHTKSGPTTPHMNECVCKLGLWAPATFGDYWNHSSNTHTGTYYHDHCHDPVRIDFVFISSNVTSVPGSAYTSHIESNKSMDHLSTHLSIIIPTNRTSMFTRDVNPDTIAH